MEEIHSLSHKQFQEIIERLSGLEKRIDRIENKIVEWDPSAFDIDTISESSDYEDTVARVDEEGLFATSVGKHVLGWLANIVFIFGIGFMASYIRNIGYPGFATLLGYAGIAGMFTFGQLLKSYSPYNAHLIKVSALVLLFYVTASLYFKVEQPFLSNLSLALLLLLAVVITQFYFALKWNKEYLSSIGVTMLLITAVFSNITHVLLPLVLITSGISVYLFLRFGWWRNLIFTLVLVYCVHNIWLFNNPIMNNPIQTVDDHQYNVLYLFGYGGLFSLPVIFRNDHRIENAIYITHLLFNALFFLITAVLVILSFYVENYAWIFALVAVLCIGYSIVLYKLSEQRYSPAFYACYGFIALSVAIYGYFDLPDSFLLLAVESLLVLSIAIWYKSTIIVIVNTILFFVLLIAYLTASTSVNIINFTFAAVALITARIVNWKKERLDLQTEFFRNVYLIAGFFIVLLALHQAVPPQYLILSWSIAAGIYFILSFLLKNFKYRWMAISTLIVTAFYLFFVDLENMSLGYRIVSFLFFAVISLSTSLYYTRKVPKSDESGRQIQSPKKNNDA